jgi:hypothetical protein
MLREILNLRQTDPAARRRWFQSDYFDLFTWQDAAGEYIGLQLCYDLRRKERALSWKRETGFFHDGVEDGAGRSGPGRATPQMVATDPFDPEKVNARFLAESADLAIDVRKFVLSKLHEYSITGPTLRRGAARRNVRRDPWQIRVATDQQAEGVHKATDGAGAGPAKDAKN